MYAIRSYYDFSLPIAFIVSPSRSFLSITISTIDTTSCAAPIMASGTIICISTLFSISTLSSGPDHSVFRAVSCFFATAQAFFHHEKHEERLPVAFFMFFMLFMVSS